MASVIIEELDKSSEDSFNSPVACDDDQAPNCEDVFHACEDGIEASPAENGSTEAEDATAPNARADSPQQQASDALSSKRGSEVSQNGPDPKEPSAEEEEKLAEAEKLKLEGNSLYSDGKYAEALEKYSEARDLAPLTALQQRAVYFANSAAARLKMAEYAAAAKDCSAALAAEPALSLQIKALTRRSVAYEKLDDLERAFADHEKLAELEPGNSSHKAMVKRLRPVVEERREKMKTEMIDKLKDLGNTVLGKFGMSLDNFKAEKDPQTGSYSINFKQ